MNFSLAIDDILAEELCKFRVNQQCDIDMVERILHYYKGYPIFTKGYFDKYYTDKNIQRNLAQSNSSITWDSIETISKGTIYKVILSSQKNVNFPYISIYDDKVENNFTATFMQNDNRQKAKEHLKALLENAKCIFVYDLYLANNWASFLNFIQECFPRKQLSILYPKEIDSNTINTNPHIPKLTQEQCSEITKIGGKSPNKNLWSFKVDNTHQNFTNLHDRYLIIDNKIEIILTSGIDNLIDDSKDFTYIVRRHKQ